MIAKRAKYFGKRVPGIPVKKHGIKTPKNLKGLLRYLQNQAHKNHVGVELGPVEFWLVSDEAAFIAALIAGAEAYRAAPKRRGAQWKGEIAEHVIFAPPDTADLDDEDRATIGAFAALKIFPRSPAVLCWHQGDDGRDELHMVGGNFDSPGLRVTEICAMGHDYMHFLRQTAEEAIELVNERRRREGRPTVPTMREIRAKNRKDAGYRHLAEEIFDVLGHPTEDKGDIIAALQVRGWRCRPTKKSLSVTPPGKKKPYRWDWETLFGLLTEIAPKLKPRPKSKTASDKNKIDHDPEPASPGPDLDA